MVALNSLGSDDDDDDIAGDNMIFRLDLSPDSEELWRNLNEQLKTRGTNIGTRMSKGSMRNSKKKTKLPSSKSTVHPG